MPTRWLILAAGLAMGTAIGAPGDEGRKVVAEGEWSKPVADSNAYALRGRLVIGEKVVSAERREFTVFVELQDASDFIGRGMLLYCEMSRSDFRPEHKGGLDCELRDPDKKVVPSTSFAFGGATPANEWVSLPADATIRLRATPFGIHRPKAMAICPGLDKMWVIADDDRGEYLLSGKFTIAPPAAPPADQTAKSGAHVWKGTIDLPPVRLKNPKR
jgi:hypothetical protein